MSAILEKLQIHFLLRFISVNFSLLTINYFTQAEYLNFSKMFLMDYLYRLMTFVYQVHYFMFTILLPKY